MLSYSTVIPHTLELLRYLMGEPYLNECRLVGGTSLDLQFGHRSSIDLDFFGNVPDNNEALEDILKGFGRIYGSKTSKLVKSFVVDGIKVDFVNYSMYPWIDDAVVEDGLRLASPKDISALKINAIEGRGSKKDFIDMYFLLQHYSLTDILRFYAKKYPNHSMFRARMSLVYFDDAEPMDCPEMFIKVDWETVKSFISEKVKEVNWNNI